MLNPINLISKIFKSSNQKELNNLAKIVAKINLLEEETAKLDDDDFINKTLELREKYKKGIKLSELLPEAYVRARAEELYAMAKNSTALRALLGAGATVDLSKAGGATALWIAAQIGVLYCL